MNNTTHFATVVLKELVNVVNKIVTPISSGFNTPATRSRANSFTRGSSGDMLSPEEHEELNRQRAENLEMLLRSSGFMNDNTHNHAHQRHINDSRRAVAPVNNGF